MVELFDNGQVLDGFLKNRAKALAMTVELCGLTDLTPDWECYPALIHSTKGFFDVIGFNVSKAAGREVAGWTQPMLKDNGGVIVLIECRQATGEPHVLVRAKAEPGNAGYALPDGSNSRVLLSPPLQFSMANLKNNPGKIPLSSLVMGAKGELNVETEPAPEDGGRFYEKVNRYGCLHKPIGSTSVDDEVEKLGAAAADFAWITMRALRTARSMGWLNGHLRSGMSLLV